MFGEAEDSQNTIRYNSYMLVGQGGWSCGNPPIYIYMSNLFLFQGMEPPEVNEQQGWPAQNKGMILTTNQLAVRPAPLGRTYHLLRVVQTQYQGADRYMSREPWKSWVSRK